jgi:hypothetical protein
MEIVCNPHVFSKAQQLRHIDHARDVLLRWPRSRTELADGYQFSYEGDEDMFLAIAGWAAAEHRCCAWASYTVEIGASSNGPSAITVRVVTTPEGKAFLTDAYRYLAALDGAPPAGLLAAPITRDGILDELNARPGS